MGQNTKVPNAHEAGWKQVEQEAAQELFDRKGHQALLITLGGVSPAKGDLVVGQGDEAMVGDGDTMRGNPCSMTDAFVLGCSSRRTSSRVGANARHSGR